jgi:hypothetical protein
MLVCKSRLDTFMSLMIQAAALRHNPKGESLRLVCYNTDKRVCTLLFFCELTLQQVLLF